MSYAILGQSLHEIADRAKAYFATEYGATNFKCEHAPVDDLPLKPTWQASLAAGYSLFIEVRESPFSNSLYEFVTRCAAEALPIRLWVVVPPTAAVPSFNAELKQARDVGVGVVQIAEDGKAHEFHRPVPLSLFALKKTDLKTIPKARREEIKTAESTFLDGSPGQGCQSICQELEQLTREFASYTYDQGLWKQKQGAAPLKKKYFDTSPWADVLQSLEERLDIARVKAKSKTFTKQAIVRARSHTDWRNAVSHKPSTFKDRKQRDAKLRTMFEVTRDVLVEWYEIAKPFKLPK